jgi:hypothetical protein
MTNQTTTNITPDPTNQGGTPQAQTTVTSVNNPTGQTGQPAGQINGTPNRDFFIKTLEDNLSPDMVKKIVGDLNKK